MSAEFLLQILRRMQASLDPLPKDILSAEENCFADIVLRAFGSVSGSNVQETKKQIVGLIRSAPNPRYVEPGKGVLERLADAKYGSRFFSPRALGLFFNAYLGGGFFGFSIQEAAIRVYLLCNFFGSSASAPGRLIKTNWADHLLSVMRNSQLVVEICYFGTPDATGTADVAPPGPNPATKQVAGETSLVKFDAPSEPQVVTAHKQRKAHAAPEPALNILTAPDVEVSPITSTAVTVMENSPVKPVGDVPVPEPVQRVVPHVEQGTDVTPPVLTVESHQISVVVASPVAMPYVPRTITPEATHDAPEASAAPVQLPEVVVNEQPLPSVPQATREADVIPILLTGLYDATPPPVTSTAHLPVTASDHANHGSNSDELMSTKYSRNDWRVQPSFKPAPRKPEDLNYSLPEYISSPTKQSFTGMLSERNIFAGSLVAFSDSYRQPPLSPQPQSPEKNPPKMSSLVSEFFAPATGLSAGHVPVLFNSELRLPPLVKLGGDNAPTTPPRMTSPVSPRTGLFDPQTPPTWAYLVDPPQSPLGRRSPSPLPTAGKPRPAEARRFPQNRVEMRPVSPESARRNGATTLVDNVLVSERSESDDVRETRKYVGILSGFSGSEHFRPGSIGTPEPRSGLAANKDGGSSLSPSPDSRSRPLAMPRSGSTVNKDVGSGPALSPDSGRPVGVRSPPEGHMIRRSVEHRSSSTENADIRAGISLKAERPASTSDAKRPGSIGSVDRTRDLVLNSLIRSGMSPERSQQVASQLVTNDMDTLQRPLSPSSFSSPRESLNESMSRLEILVNRAETSVRDGAKLREIKAIMAEIRDLSSTK